MAIMKGHQTCKTCGAVLFGVPAVVNGYCRDCTTLHDKCDTCGADLMGFEQLGKTCNSCLDKKAEQRLAQPKSGIERHFEQEEMEAEEALLVFEAATNNDYDKGFLRAAWLAL